jgi:hypothetical protein
MAEHTEGPWEAIEITEGNWHVLPIDRHPHRLPIAILDHHRDGHEPTRTIITPADARLMAAAPELLEALRIAKAAIRGINDDGTHRGDKRGLIGFSDDEREMIDAAIAKAQGK